MIRVRRAVTRPYSAATKNAFSTSRPRRASSSSPRVMRSRPLRARAYWAAARRPSGSTADRSSRGRRRNLTLRTHDWRLATNVCSMIGAEVGIEYREEPCKAALNRVKGMAFGWSLNPYTGCAHRCTFCYVRAFEHRADRPFDERYGRSIRVKVNVAEVLRAELARSTWQREDVAIGAATDPYQPAEGRYKLTRACLEALRDASNPFSIITRGPMIVRDLDVLAPDAGRGRVAADRAVDRAPAAAVARDHEARRGRNRRPRRHGADPPGDLGPAGATARGRPGGSGGRRHRHLGQPPLSPAGNARALPGAPRRRLARAASL